jgi:hypothetical protein
MNGVARMRDALVYFDDGGNADEGGVGGHRAGRGSIPAFAPEA